VTFFPVSSVGLDAHPFGVLEPLLWLLHTQGYCVLEK
jgi:hypothetical protein